MHEFDVFSVENVLQRYVESLLAIERLGAIPTTPSVYLEKELSSRIGKDGARFVMAISYNPEIYNSMRRSALRKYS